jgi:hypothetical protein
MIVALIQERHLSPLQLELASGVSGGRDGTAAYAPRILSAS